MQCRSTTPPASRVPAEPEQTHVTPTTIAGATLAYAIDRLYAGATVAVVYRAPGGRHNLG